MRLPALSVARPVSTLMGTLIVLLVGLVSWGRLRLDLLPPVELPTVTITTEYEGASPEVMERQVTQIVEEVVATVPGVAELTSSSTEGASEVVVKFVWGVDLDAAASDVRARLEEESNEFPTNMPRPRIAKFDAASFPVVALGISSDGDPVQLTTLIENQIRYRFSQLPGVAQVDPWGGYDREIRVELDPERIKALALPVAMVLDALMQANVDLPAGEIESGNEAIMLRAPAQFSNLDQIRDTVVTVRDGAPVRLAQIASVLDTHRRLTEVARVNGRLGVRVAVRKEADANTVEVAERILAEVEAIRRDIPGIEIIPVVNQGGFIERSLNNVASSVFYGGGLAILVLLVFLRSLRSTVVIALAIPVSLIATLGIMQIAGMTINLMSLGGMALGVGMMVDNSIVVLENIYRRHHTQGEDARDASINGAHEVGPAIVASTVTTLVIFLPLVFVRGVSGILFRDLAYVIAFSLTCSLVVSLSVLPMLASRLLARRPSPSEERSITQMLGDTLGRLDHGYSRLLDGCLAHRGFTVLVFAIALAASLSLFSSLGSEFMPPSDEGEVRVRGEMPVGSKLELVDRQTKRLESLVYPAVPETISSIVNVAAASRRPQEAYRGEVQLSLGPVGQRSRSNREIAADLRRELEGKIPGMEIRTRAPQGQFLLERILGTDQGLTIEVRGFDLAVLDRLARAAATEIEGIEGVTDVDVGHEAGSPQQAIRTDRAKAGALGVTPSDVARTVETAVAGREVGKYYIDGLAHRILVQLADVVERPISDVLDLPLRARDGSSVALRSVVAAERGMGPTVIERKNQRRLVKVSANVDGRDMGSVAAEMEARFAALPKPEGYTLAVTGAFEEQKRSFSELLVSLVVSILLVYMVLAAQYESLVAPLIIMVTIPTAAMGVLVIMAATDTTFNVQSYLGCIMLGGIVVNNAILLVDQAQQLRGTGMSPLAAAAEAGRRRLRPILMTTLTTMLGLLPLALGFGEGADAQAPLARVVIGGLASSTLVALLLVPAIDSFVAELLPQSAPPDSSRS